MLMLLNACEVTGVGVEGTVGYDAGYYEPYGYDYGGWAEAIAWVRGEAATAAAATRRILIGPRRLPGRRRRFRAVRDGIEQHGKQHGKQHGFGEQAAV